MNKSRFESDLTALINAYSLENESNTPDFILAQYLVQCLNAFNITTSLRNTWRAKHITPNPAEEFPDGVL